MSEPGDADNSGQGVKQQDNDGGGDGGDGGNGGNGGNGDNVQQDTKFWGSQFTADGCGGLEPKRAFRWRLVTDAFSPWFIKKVSRPSFTIGDISHKFLNHTFYYPGRIEWQEISVTLVDPATPDAAEKTMAFLAAAGYVFPDAATSFGTISKGKSASAFGAFVIQVLDASGDVALESWSLINPWIKSVTFSELDYEQDALTDITLTVRYDFAKLTTLASTACTS